LGTQLPAERGLEGSPQAVANGVAPAQAPVDAKALNAAPSLFPAEETSDLEPLGELETAKPPLSLRLVNGPLPPRERSRILAEYNRLTLRRIPIQTFTRCTEQSPEGPAIHALLETPEGSIVGHCCLVPFRMHAGRRRFTVAKAEYFFVSGDHRSRAVHGFEGSGRPAAAALLEQLYRQGAKRGWGPLLASPSQGSQALQVLAGCQPVEFSMTECFFVLNPLRAWQWGSCLPSKQRRTLFLVGLAQSAFSTVVLPFTYDGRLVRNPRIGEGLPTVDTRGDNRLALAETEDFLRWRYPDEAYSRFVPSDGSPGYAIVQKGGHGEYLRVHQSRAPGNGQTSPLIAELIRQAGWSRALGVRWCVYGKGPEQDRLVSELRKLGFSCVPTRRRVAVYTTDPQFLSPDKWNLSDSLFTFEDLFLEPALA
jgi:hypothetical protein